MTREELEKEAIAKYKTGSYPQLHPDFRAFVHGYLSGAEPREKRIADLEKEIAELKRDKEDLIFIRNQKAKCMCEDKETISKAKEIIRNLLRVTYGEGWNYSLDWKVKAEDFLKESE